MSGFGSRWTRRPSREFDAYPEYAELRRQALATTTGVTNFSPPMAVGPIRYEDTAANAAEIAGFQAALADQGGSFADAFLTVPSPGIVAMAMKNAYYPDDDAYRAAVAPALQRSEASRGGKEAVGTWR